MLIRFRFGCVAAWQAYNGMPRASQAVENHSCLKYTTTRFVALVDVLKLLHWHITGYSMAHRSPSSASAWSTVETNSPPHRRPESLHLHPKGSIAGRSSHVKLHILPHRSSLHHAYSFASGVTQPLWVSVYQSRTTCCVAFDERCGPTDPTLSFNPHTVTCEP